MGEPHDVVHESTCGDVDEQKAVVGVTDRDGKSGPCPGSHVDLDSLESDAPARLKGVSHPVRIGRLLKVLPPDTRAQSVEAELSAVVVDQIDPHTFPLDRNGIVCAPCPSPQGIESAGLRSRYDDHLSSGGVKRLKNHLAVLATAP